MTDPSDRPRNKLGDWASKRITPVGRRYIVEDATPPRPAPSFRPQPDPAAEEEPQRGAVIHRDTRPSIRHHASIRDQTTRLVRPTPPPQTCFIVKPGNVDPYVEFLNGLPDVGVEDLSGGFDAMAVPGVPEGAQMAKWTPSARRTYGGSDNAAPTQETVSQHISSHYGGMAATSGSIRSGNGNKT